ncbi:MAG: DUF4062 domain-containing protein [Treponema sp.]|jgi:hypothetical protein|nr:DUF4062 domain-containing protein [Treponema sp.]
MITKYHIFISSAPEDLKNERLELEKLIFELGHIPVVPALFDTENKTEGKIVNKIIEECDYFLVPVAHKYGAERRPSPAEAEFSHAVRAGIPVIALIIDEKARRKASKREKEGPLIEALENFKDKLRDYPYDTWAGVAEVRQKTRAILIQEMNLNPRQGWVRGNEAVQPGVANELARLSSENEALKRQLKPGKESSRETLTRLKAHTRRALKILSSNKIFLSFYYAAGKNWENTREYRYLHLFKLLAPELSLGKNTAELSRFLGNTLNPDPGKTPRKDFPAPSNTIKKVMADFALLKLVKTAENYPGSGEDEAWEITEYGKDLYAAYRMHQLERAANEQARPGRKAK